jgi:subtilisin family serine protease
MCLDFNLRHLRREDVDPTEVFHVLVQFKTDVRVLYELGCRVTSRVGDVAAVFVRAGDLEKLQRCPEVVFVEASRPFRDETDVSTVGINLTDSVTGTRTIPSDGRGALIGVVDSGFDLTHPCFLNAQGKTRILAAWDQVNLNASAGVPPPVFGYGREYTGAIIDEHVAAKRAVVVRNQEGAGAHGTYVVGIAAGNGVPHGVYRGVAPEAELVLVIYRNDVPVGGSAYVLDAIEYIRIQAAASGRPAVINLSQGDNLGAHDGTSLLERAIDQIIDEGRVLIVISAGNERGGPASHHARGRVEQGRELSLLFALTPGHRIDGDMIDLWYHGGDRFAVALRAPSGEMSSFIEPGGPSVVAEFSGGKRAHIGSQTNHPTNGDNHVGVVLQGGEDWETGVWRLVLRGDRVERGDFDAWADRPNAVTAVGFQSHQSDASTITTPGNSRRAITVGGFISRPSRGGLPEEAGDLAPGSSIGPTRDGRVKPDLTAPSTLIMAPRLRVDRCPLSYDLRCGTSMAAPHVSGVAALLWALWPGLAAGRIRNALLSTARGDDFTGATPNTRWGRGKLDAGAAYRALSILVAEGAQTMAEAKVFEFETSPRENRDGAPVGMRIRIEVGEANLAITGTSTGASDGDNYVGTLTLRKVKAGPIVIGQEGGDECWVNGVWKVPCPAGSPEE